MRPGAQLSPSSRAPQSSSICRTSRPNRTGCVPQCVTHAHTRKGEFGVMHMQPAVATERRHRSGVDPACTPLPPLVAARDVAGEPLGSPGRHHCSKPFDRAAPSALEGGRWRAIPLIRAQRWRCNAVGPQCEPWLDLHAPAWPRSPALNPNAWRPASAHSSLAIMLAALSKGLVPVQTAAAAAALPAALQQVRRFAAEPAAAAETADGTVTQVRGPVCSLPTLPGWGARASRRDPSWAGAPGALEDPHNGWEGPPGRLAAPAAPASCATAAPRTPGFCPPAPPPAARRPPRSPIARAPGAEAGPATPAAAAAAASSAPPTRRADRWPPRPLLIGCTALPAGHWCRGGCAL